jgi:hypothetical protein
MDIVAEGLLPILVVVENHNSSSSFLFSKEQISLTDSTQGTTTTSTRTKTPDEGLGVALMTTGVFVNPIMAFTGLSLAADAQIKQLNLAERELAKRTVSTNGNANGFVYFQLRKNAKLPAAFGVTVEATSLGTNRSLSFHFPVSLQQPIQ